ncbi:MAG: hypothetical protein WC700_10125 [Gemmatimonadaceae bacterium]|jgi:hypothetical protein
MAQIVFTAGSRDPAAGEPTDEHWNWLLDIDFVDGAALRAGFVVFEPRLVGYHRLLEFACGRDGDELTVAPGSGIRIVNGLVNFMAFSDACRLNFALAAEPFGRGLRRAVEALDAAGYFGEQSRHASVPTPREPAADRAIISREIVVVVEAVL